MFDVGNSVVESLFGQVAGLGGVIQHLPIIISCIFLLRSRRRRNSRPSPVGWGWLSLGRLPRCQSPSCRLRPLSNSPGRTAHLKRIQKYIYDSLLAFSGRTPSTQKCCTSAKSCFRSKPEYLHRTSSIQFRFSSCIPSAVSDS